MIFIFMNKKCPLCNIEKSLESFSKNSSRKDGLSGHCKECHKVLRKNHYELNKSKILRQVSNRKVRYNEWLVSIKKDKPCVDCGKVYPHYVMDFDHLRDKKFNISNARQGGWSKETVLTEISKCDLVCSNCHRERTYKRLFAPLA